MQRIDQVYSTPATTSLKGHPQLEGSWWPWVFRWTCHADTVHDIWLYGGFHKWGYLQLPNSGQIVLLTSGHLHRCHDAQEGAPFSIPACEPCGSTEARPCAFEKVQLRWQLVVALDFGGLGFILNIPYINWLASSPNTLSLCAPATLVAEHKLLGLSAALWHRSRRDLRCQQAAVNLTFCIGLGISSCPLQLGDSGFFFDETFVIFCAWPCAGQRSRAGLLVALCRPPKVLSRPSR